MAIRFGCKRTALDWRSDPDFALEGLDSTEQYRVSAEPDERMKIPASIVHFENVNRVLRAEILTWGKLLYEA
jgi:hypothetical protein